MAVVGKERICEALMRASIRKSLDKITVTDIITLADINRSSFYYHFHNVQDVLDYMCEIVAHHVRTIYDDMNFDGVRSFDDMHDEFLDLTTSLYQRIYGDRNYILFLRNRCDKGILYDKLLESCEDSFRSLIVYFRRADGELYTMPRYEFDRYVRFMAYREVSIIDIWAEEGFSLPVDYMVRFTAYIATVPVGLLDKSDAFPHFHVVRTLDMDQALGSKA